YQLQTLDPTKLPRLQDQIWALVKESNLDKDMGQNDRPKNFDDFVLHMDGYVCELKDAQIRGCLHVLGSPPRGETIIDLMVELTRRTNEGVTGLRSSLHRAVGLSEDIQAGVPLCAEVREAVESVLDRCHLDGGPTADG